MTSSAFVLKSPASKPTSLLSKPKPRWQTASLSAFFIMAKRKTNKPQVKAGMEACDAAFKPRRSIPVEQVDGIIEREVARVKSELTIFDERLAIIRQVEETEADLEYLNTRTHETQIQNKQLRSDLTRINLAIQRQMELDGE